MQQLRRKFSNREDMVSDRKKGREKYSSRMRRKWGLDGEQKEEN